MVSLVGCHWLSQEKMPRCRETKPSHSPLQMSRKRERRPVDRFVASPGGGKTKEKFDPKFQSLLTRARISPYDFQKVPRCAKDLSESIVLRILNREQLTQNIGELYHLCWEANRRKQVSLVSDENQAVLPPLDVNYMADRIDIDDPIQGYMVRHADGGWLQGFLCLTTFTHWQLWFQWNSLAPEAGLLPPLSSSSSPISSSASSSSPLLTSTESSVLNCSSNLLKMSEKGTMANKTNARSNKKTAKNIRLPAEGSGGDADKGCEAEPERGILKMMGGGRFWNSVVGPRERRSVIPPQMLSYSSPPSNSSNTNSSSSSNTISSNTTSKLSSKKRKRPHQHEEEETTTINGVLSKKVVKRTQNVTEPLRCVDTDGRLSSELEDQERSGDPTAQGVVWPRVAEISLLGGLGCGGFLVRTLIAELEKGDQYDFIVLQATEQSMPFYESIGFIRVGAIAKYARRSSTKLSFVLPNDQEDEDQAVAYRHWTFCDEPLLNNVEASKMMVYKLKRIPLKPATSHTKSKKNRKTQEKKKLSKVVTDESVRILSHLDSLLVEDCPPIKQLPTYPVEMATVLTCSSYEKIGNNIQSYQKTSNKPPNKLKSMTLNPNRENDDTCSVEVIGASQAVKEKVTSSMDFHVPCPCTTCDQTFLNYNQMYQHKQSEHPELIKKRTNRSKLSDSRKKSISSDEAGEVNESEDEEKEEKIRKNTKKTDLKKKNEFKSSHKKKPTETVDEPLKNKHQVHDKKKKAKSNQGSNKSNHDLKNKKVVPLLNEIALAENETDDDRKSQSNKTKKTNIVQNNQRSKDVSLDELKEKNKKNKKNKNSIEKIKNHNNAKKTTKKRRSELDDLLPNKGLELNIGQQHVNRRHQSHRREVVEVDAENGEGIVGGEPTPRTLRALALGIRRR